MRFFYTALIFGSISLMPFLVLADETPALPVECPGTIENYNVINVALTGNGEGTNGDDFIFAGDNNSIDINGGNGSDCILVGNGNMASVAGVNGKDTIVIGDNNSGNVFGGNGADQITVGSDNEGNISGENGEDNITLGCSNNGSVDEDFKQIPCLPTADPLSGTYTKIQNISLASEDSASIYYTLDGTTPTCSPVSGILYKSPIQIFSTTTITAVGCSEDGLASEIATFTYTIEKIKVETADLLSLLAANVFVPKDGTTTAATTEISVIQNVEIKIGSASENTVILEKGLIISRVDGDNFDANMLTSSNVNTGSLAGLASGSVMEGALQWGIPNIGLQFSKPITISIFVGIDLNGQTLNIVRSVSGTGDWTSDGIVSPATCVVNDGLCTFQATKASYYVVYMDTSPVQTNNSGSGGGGGGGGSYINTIVTVDDVPVQPAQVQPIQNEPVPNDTKLSEEKVMPVAEAVPTPLITPVPKLIAKATPHKQAPVKQELKTVSNTDQLLAKERRPFFASVFASIGRLIFRLPFFHR